MSRRRQALGRGLGSLLPTDEGVGLDARFVPIDEITPNRYQPRTVMDEDALAELTDSIRQHGVLEPIIVRPVTEGYELVVGERRWRAARRAELKEIPAVVRQLSDQETAIVALVENLQREDLNPIEEARAYQRLLDMNLTQQAIASQVGRSRPAVANSLRLLTLDEETQSFISSGELSVGHAKVLLGVDAARRPAILQQILRAGLTVRQTEELAREAATAEQVPSPRPVARRKRRDPVWLDIEDRLAEALGTKVQVQKRGKGGRIVIDFYGEEDIDRLLELVVPRGT